MIIIIDEASAKLASFYYHDEIFKPEWRNASNMASVSGELQAELQEKIQEKLPDEQQNNLCVYEIKNNSGYNSTHKMCDNKTSVAESINVTEKNVTEYADDTAKTNIGNLRIPESLTDYIWIVSNKQQKQIADSLGIASVGEPQCGTRYAVESLAELDIEYLERVRRRYNHIPWDIGETDRCLIRELSLSDLPALYELYAKPGMTDYVEPLYDYETELEYQKAYIENMYGFYEYGMWLVFSKETGKLIGRAGLEHDEMGYMIAPELWNQGYATEVCRFIIDYARENTDFEELYCRIDERNEASVRLAKKLGFVRNAQIGNERNTDELDRYVLSF